MIQTSKRIVTTKHANHSYTYFIKEIVYETSCVPSILQLHLRFTMVYTDNHYLSSKEKDNVLFLSNPISLKTKVVIL